MSRAASISTGLAPSRDAAAELERLQLRQAALQRQWEQEREAAELAQRAAMESEATALKERIADADSFGITAARSHRADILGQRDSRLPLALELAQKV
jgi:hypothetical protein